MEPTKFFNTQSDPTIDTGLLKKKQQFGSYVSHLDLHINKAINCQQRALNKKKHNLLQTLQKMKDQVQKQSEKTRKMQQFFYIHCEKILKQDISKWDGNKDFFKNVSHLYDHKISQKQNQVNFKKRQVERKNKQLKQMLRNLRKKYTVEQYTQKLTTNRKQELSTSKNQTQTLDTSARMTRIKTQTSLPSLRKPMRTKTMADYQSQQIKNYMKPIKTQKTIQSSNFKDNLIQILTWYKSDKIQYNWFEKVIFVERNFKKIISSLSSEAN